MHTRLRTCVALICALTGCLQDAETHHADEVAGIPSFDEWVESLPRSPTGGHVVEGDMPFYDQDALREYYETMVSAQALTIDSISTTVDNKHSASRARTLSYCVSNEFRTFFGSIDYKTTVVNAMNAATTAWENAAGTSAGVRVVDFQYVSAHDANCNSGNTTPFFYVRPISTSAQAIAFFPNDSRSNRVLWIGIDGLTPAAPVTVAGILRHELGHVLGFRHEHARVSGDPCREGASHRSITAFDQRSVMHYPGVTSSSTYPCGSDESRDDNLTTYDTAGVKCIYNPSVDACKGMRISTTAPQFTADNNGTVYRLNSARTAIQQYRIPSSGALPTWTSHSTIPAASAIRAGGTQLYRVNSADNRLYRWTGTGWTSLGDAGSSLAVAYTAGHAYRLNSNGTISRVTSTGTSWSTILSTTASGRTLFAGTTNVFRRDADGRMYQWTSGTSWTLMTTGTQIAQDRNGVIYALDSAGVVRRRESTGAWTQIGTGMGTIRGGLDTVYASTTAAPTTVLRYRTGTAWHTMGANISQLFGGGPRKLARMSGSGGTVAGELFDYLYPSPG